MNREVHVRFWEGLAVRFRWATQLVRAQSHPGCRCRGVGSTLSHTGEIGAKSCNQICPPKVVPPS